MPTPPITVGLYVRLEAKPGQEAAVAAFLTGALPLVAQEAQTITWYALQLSHNTFGIFDSFPDEGGRSAHLAGPVAAALMAKAGELLVTPPTIQRVDILSAKLPQ